MNPSKEKLLYETHEKLMSLALDNKQPLTELKKVATDDVMGYGTTFDEKISSIKEFINLIKIQREQSEGLDMGWKITPVMRRISADTNTAVFADDLLLNLNMGGQDVSMHMRFSTIFEFINDSWKLVHWHGSKPENAASETDMFGIDVWKQKYAELEKLVKERTEELLVKNKELEIEAALERVRARTMAMQKSDELVEASQLLDQQVRALGIETWGCAFHIYGENDSDELAWDEEWFSSEQGILTPYKMPRENIFKKYYEKGKEGKPLHIEEIKEDEIEAHYEYLQSLPIIGEALKEAFASGVPLPKSQFDHVAFFDQGHLLFITYEPVPEAHDIFVRFAQVFQQTYTRFLDLQKAEKRVRESQIEAALERVRTKTMAMHNSNDVSDTVLTLFNEIQKLGLDSSIRCGICIDQGTDHMQTWSVSAFPNRKVDLKTGLLNMTVHPLLIGARKAWKNKLPRFTYLLKDKEVTQYYNVINNEPHYPFYVELDSLPEIMHLNTFNFSEGFIFSFTPNPISGETENILKRFTGVFGQTYRRYLDLLSAEAQAIESKIEAALEKVRSRTLAMQNSDELAEVVAVLFQQLIGLGIAPNRLYIGTIKDNSGIIEFWITDEKGEKVSKKFFGKIQDNNTIKKMYSGWQSKKQSLVIDINGKELSTYFEYLGNQLKVLFKDGFSQKRRIQYISYFSKGFIGMVSPDEQPQDTIELLNRFAYVFNLTFTRFNDLKIAEANALKAEQDLIEIKDAKRKAEKALVDLQATQKQLIQSEKMASLGELTAGIAHEIQNPLNFVNNFSDVSSEMIDEMNEELDKNEVEEARAIAADIKQNLEKINHHGKRADAIVKGMLQHSRSNTGEKEPTKINVLADEYLRLAYHGLRAKDKSFNATLETDFDETIGKVNISRQDIGRVLLNLINNAFYAVSERQRQNMEGLNTYTPTVSVSTKKSGDKIEIKVSDNGNGIPEQIRDKIFQPFFTTKPTGQGTGLGLSLSYDIVKAHGGELKVETKEGEGLPAGQVGTTFTIIIPTINA